MQSVSPLKTNVLIPVAICILLGVITWFVFGQTTRFEFLNYDDDSYVYDNPHVTNGLTWREIAWAFTHVHSNNWHPLTTISHMLDCQLNGLKPGGHHLTNVLLHIAAVILCFLVLWQMTEKMYRSAVVAAIFAVHPLHVESVAWVSERKDVLSAVFFMLTLAAYTWYVRGPQRFARYAVLVIAFTAGLLSKPMLVTVPVLLLLLDYWPLGRYPTQPSDNASAGSWKSYLPRLQLIVEKLPLFVLSAASCAVTIFAQKAAMSSMEKLPLVWRVKNAIVVCTTYVWQMFWPKDLAVFYPHPKSQLSILVVISSALIIALITTATVANARKRPYLAVGWLWYLLMLLPVIGVLQVGLQSHADRYTYLPQIGLFVAITWAVAETKIFGRYQLPALSVVTAIVMVVLAWSAHRQALVWRDSESLWRHALSVTPDNEIAEHNLGFALGVKGESNEAMAHLQQALQFDPNFAAAYNNIALLLTRQKRWDEGIIYYEKALQLGPNDAASHYNLASALVNIGKRDEAIAHYQRAIEINPDYVQAHNNLGNVFFGKHQLEQAITQYRKALDIKPDHLLARNNLALVLLETGDINNATACWQKNLSIQPGNIDARNNLAVVLLKTGHPAEALSEWQAILRFHPDNAAAMVSIAWVLATSPDDSVRNAAKALSLATRVQPLADQNDPVVYRTLAAALAESGRFSEAVEMAERGWDLASTKNDHDLMEKLRNERELYRANLSFRDAPGAPTPAPSR